MNDAMEKEISLSQVPFFKDVPEDILNEIAQVTEKKVVPEGTVIFRQNDPGDSFYVINSGRVRVFRRDRDGVETELSRLGPGDSFGEMALTTGDPRSAHVEAVEETHLTVLSKERFDQILSENPQVSMIIIKKLTDIIKKGEAILEKDTQEKVRERWISLYDYVIIIGLSLLCAIVFNQSNPNGISLIPQHLFDEAIPGISPEEALKKLESGEALFLDARPSNFYDKDHIKGAKNLPLGIFDIMYMMELSEVPKDKEIIINGRSFSTRYDDQVARKLKLLGHKDVKILEGGLSRWEKKGYPVES